MSNQVFFITSNQSKLEEILEYSAPKKSWKLDL